MKALIVYASLFGHNRVIARAIAEELGRHEVQAVTMPISKIMPGDEFGYDILLLGTYTHGAHASQKMRAFCESIPLRVLEGTAIALFGTQMEASRVARQTGGIEDLELCLAERGCEVATKPLRILLQTSDAFKPWPRLTADQHHLIAEFAADLLEVCVPEPFI